MKEVQKLTKDQLYSKLKEGSESFYSAVSPTLENNFFTENSLDEDSFAEFLEMLDEETAEKIKESSLNISHDEDIPDILLMENETGTSLNLVTDEGEGYKIILVEDDILLSGNLFIEDYVVLIISGSLKAENIIVKGSLYCSGNISCSTLFGASGNDNETWIGGSIMAALVAENGHYTVAEGNIYSRYSISFHNEITGKRGKFIENISMERASDTALLNPEILDDDGYFDEESFLSFINSNSPQALFR